MHNIISSKDVRLLTSSSISSSDSASDKPFCSESFQGEVDAYEARDRSQHYFTNLRVASSRCITKITQLASAESIQSSHSTIVSGITVAGLERGMSAVSLRVEVSYHSVVTVEPWYLSYAEIAAVASPSDTKPIAPDGTAHVFMHNSSDPRHQLNC